MTTPATPPAATATRPPRALRVFAAAKEDPRSRRATDIILLTVSMFGLATLTLAESPQPALTRSIAEVLTGLPDMLDALWQLFSDLMVLFALVLIVVCVVRRRWSIGRDLVAAMFIALVISAAVTRALDGDWPPLLDSIRRTEPPPRYLPPRLALPAAVVITLSPHLTLPVRRIGRWLLGLSAIGGVALGAISALGVLAGPLVGLLAASVVHLVFGSSGGRPSLAQVGAKLENLGLTADRLTIAEEPRAGVFLVRAHEHPDDLDNMAAADAEGPLEVRIYARDAHGAAIVSTVWQTLWLREPRSPAGFGRVEQVVHEAFLTLLAERSGVITDTVVTAAATEDDDALLVLRRTGHRLDEVAEQASGVITDLWHVLDTLHRAGIAHGQVDERHLVVHDGRLGIVDFGEAAVEPTALQFRADRVQALVTQVLILGIDPAVNEALGALGADGLAEILPLAQMSMLTAPQRRQVRALALDLDELRSRAAAITGIDEPPEQQLRRFTFGSIARVALPAVAVLALIAALSGLDFELLGAEFSGATWWLIAVGVIVSQLPRLTQAVSTLGASPIPLPLGPTYALQLAVSYINLAIPSGAARMAVNIRFFQRHGVPAGGALAAGGLDGFSGFLMQLLLLTTFLLFTPLSLDLDLDLPSGGSATRLILIVLIVGGALISALFAVRRLRRFVLGWAKQLFSEAVSTIRGLRSPRRLALLLGGNLASELLFAISLGVFARAFGHAIGLGELLLTVISVSLLAGLLPVPGGIGVSEGGLVFGLVTAGVPEEAAFAIVIAYRLATFYVPPVWGFFALRWLERNQHL